MRYRISISIVVFFCLVLFNSCKKQNDCDCFKPRGETVTDTRSVTAFTTLQTFDKIDVYYIQDTTSTACTVKVVTGKNLVSNVFGTILENMAELFQKKNIVTPNTYFF